MHRNPIAVVWIGGLLLALIVYTVGPDQFTATMLAVLDGIDQGVRDVIRHLTLASFDVVRALAIGLFVVFVALALMAIRQGLRGRVSLLVISLLFLLLVWDHGGYASAGRWVLALGLSAVGALSMTSRLTGAARLWSSGGRRMPLER